MISSITNRPEPVGNANTIAGLVIVFVKVLVAWLTIAGYIDWGEAEQVAFVAMVVAGVDVAVVVVSLFLATRWSRSLVTPLVSPMDNQGRALVPKE